MSGNAGAKGKEENASVCVNTVLYCTVAPGLTSYNVLFKQLMKVQNISLEPLSTVLNSND